MAIIFIDRQVVRLIINTADNNDYWIESELKTADLKWDEQSFKSCKIKISFLLYKSQTCFVKYAPNSPSISYIYTKPTSIFFRADGIFGFLTFGAERSDSIRFTTPFPHSVSFSILESGEIYKFIINNDVPDGEAATVEKALYGDYENSKEIEVHDNR